MGGKYYVYGNAGGIDAVKARVVDDSHYYVDDVFTLLKNRRSTSFGVKGSSLLFYTYDDRISRDVYVVVDSAGYFRCYVIRDEGCSMTCLRR